MYTCIILSSMYLLWFTHDLNFVSRSKSQCPSDHIVAWGTYYGAPWSIMPDMYTAAPWCQRIGEPSNKLCSSWNFRLYTWILLCTSSKNAQHHVIFTFFSTEKRAIHPLSGSNHSNYCTIAVGLSDVTGSKCIKPFRWLPDRLWGNPR